MGRRVGFTFAPTLPSTVTLPLMLTGYRTLNSDWGID